ncbi:MAG: chemotaxis protein CheA [Candidatus Methanospirareceae archaeon]
MSEEELSEYMDEFVEETREHIQALIQALMKLEQKDIDSSEALDEAFRIAHTIKGTSALMGFKNMQQFCHSMEDVLEALHSRSIEVNEEIIDLLLRSATKLEEILKHIEERGSDDVDVSLMKLELERYKERGGREEKGVEREEGGKRIYEIKVVLDRGCEFRGARGFLVLRKLSELGEIVKTIPSSEDIEEENFDFEFKVIIETEAREEEVRRVFDSIADIESVEITEVKKRKDVKEEYEGGKRKEEERIRRKKGAVRSVRVSIDKLDTVIDLIGELVINKSRLMQISKEKRIEELREVMAIQERIIKDLQYEAMQMRMVPVARIFEKFPKLVRDLYRAQGKEVEFIIEGKDIELDRTVLDEIVDPLLHLLRNAVDHGIEPPEERVKKGKDRKGRIRLVARRERDYVTISVEDDGRGIEVEKVREKAVKRGLISAEEAAKLTDEEVLKFIFIPNFSTMEKVNEVSGRGVGMDVVKAMIEEVGGSVEVHTEKDKGTRVTLKVPLTTAIIQALLVKVQGRTYAIPLSNVNEIISVSREEIKTIHGKAIMMLRGSVLPLIMLQSLLRHTNVDSEEEWKEKEEFVAVVVEKGGIRVGLIVDEALKQQEIVVKPPDEILKNTKGLGGFTILGDGKVIPILDVATLV